MMEWLLDLLFPPKCVFCGKLLAEEEKKICRNCRNDLPETERRQAVPLTTGCVAPFQYSGVVRESILRYKFGGRQHYAAVYGPMIASRLQGCKADLVTFVPVSRRRKFSRGYDQAELLARETAKSLTLPCAKVLRKKHTRKQSGMKDAAARRANISGAFALRDNADVREKHILLIDDICTTGATLSEAALVLHTAGAKAVSCAVLALTDETKNSR